MARRFPAHWRESAKRLRKVDNTGVVLQTTTPPEAILLIRDPDPEYYSEGEVVVEPFSLGVITMVERG